MDTAHLIEPRDEINPLGILVRAGYKCSLSKAFGVCWNTEDGCAEAFSVAVWALEMLVEDACTFGVLSWVPLLQT